MSQFARLVEHMGSDDSIVQAARISYNEAGYAEDPVKTRHLIRYLMRNWHTTPFEMVEFKFHIKAPIYVARQWLRHRTASVNEVSARYTQIKEDEFYVPIEFRKQSKTNHQGSDPSDHFDYQKNYQFNELQSATCNAAFENYKLLLEHGVAKELARGVLPVCTMTEFYWKIDLHNLFHFLRLRMSDHAQLEIANLAKIIYDAIKPIVPMACEAFEDYRLNAVTLTGPEILAIRSGDCTALSKREQDEFKIKCLQIGIE
jgi:thymidylate synthase (FAD)